MSGFLFVSVGRNGKVSVTIAQWLRWYIEKVKRQMAAERAMLREK